MSGVGNDLVDLTLPENAGRWKEKAFVKKVFREREAEAILSARDRDLALWSTWAAKEAVYKARRKTEACAFAPRDIRVWLERGEALWDAVEYRLSFQASREWASCVAIPSGGRTLTWVAKTGETVEGYLTDEERASVSLPASEQLRLMTKLELSRLGYRYDDIQIVRRPEGKQFGPPLVYLAGERSRELDVSFSHDGSYVAAALFLSWNAAARPTGRSKIEMSCE